MLPFLPHSAITPALLLLVAVTGTLSHTCLPAAAASTTPTTAPTFPSLPGGEGSPLSLLIMAGSTFCLSLLLPPLLLLLRAPPILALPLTSWLLLLLLVCAALCNPHHCLQGFRAFQLSAVPAPLPGPWLSWPTFHLSTWPITSTWPTPAPALLGPASAATGAIATCPAICVASSCINSGSAVTTVSAP
jgi:hypothetical protein